MDLGKVIRETPPEVNFKNSHMLHVGILCSYIYHKIKPNVGIKIPVTWSIWEDENYARRVHVSSPMFGDEPI